MSGTTLAENRNKRRKMMLEDQMVKVLVIVAVPMIISMVIDSLYNMADAYFVSQLGKVATAAVGVNDSLAHFLRAISMGFGVGASSYISRLMGAKREDEASCVATTIIITAMLSMAVLSVVALVFVEQFVMLLGSTEGSRQYSTDYAKFILAAAPFTAGEVVLSQTLRAEGSSKLSMVGMVSGCLVNIVLDPIFISVLGLEVAGAAMATAISKVVSFCILLSPFLRQKTLLEIKFRYFTPKKEIYKEVARMGIPAFLRTSMLSVATIVTNNVAGSFGDVALAASSITNRCTRFVSSAIMGFAQGLQPVAGYCWGAKSYRRVRQAFWTCCKIGTEIGLVVGVIMLVFSPALVGVFAGNDTDIISIGSLMIRSQCVTLIPHVWVMIANSLFLALGWAKTAGVLSLSRQLLCFVPCVILLSIIFGITGLAIAQAVADILSMLIAIPMICRLMKFIKQTERNQS